MGLIEVQGVWKHYASHTALSDVSIGIQRGRIFGLLGPNGAGKTSLIRIINCITAPDKGEVLFDGVKLRPEHVECIGYLPEERGLYRKMKVGEQAIYLARLKGLSKMEAVKRLKDWFDKFDIMPWWDKRVEELSKGMQQKVQFVCTVLHRPELLIFDEPFSGFDPVNAELLKQEILELKRQGHTIIFSTHNMQSVEEICDDIALIDRSRVVLSGVVHEVRMTHASPTASLRVLGLFEAKEFTSGEILSLSSDGVHTDLTLTIPQNGDLRDLLAGIPERCTVLSLKRDLPSMHDIFLQTVNHHGE